MPFSVASSSSRLFLPLFYQSVPVKRFTAITFVSFFSSNSTKMEAPATKNILITGGTDGIGREAVHHFASLEHYNVFFTGRSAQKAQNVCDQCEDANHRPPTFLQYDFSLDTQVNKFGEEVARNNNFDICIINHGVMFPNEMSTENNRNSTMMTNLVSSYIIAHQLIRGRANDERNLHFVFTTSRLITFYPYRWYLSYFGKFNPTLEEHWTRMCENTTTSGWKEYMASKMGMATLASAITNANLHNVTANCVHPGIIFTNLMSTLNAGRQTRARCLIYLFGTSLIDGGRHLVNAALNPLTALGRYWFCGAQRTLPTNDYSTVTIGSFNLAMERLRESVEQAGL